MKKHDWIRTAAAFVATIMTASIATAGTVVELSTQSKKDGGGDATMYLDKGKLRIDSSEKGKNYSVIYQIGGEDGMKYWIIDQDEKSYTVITQADIKKIQSQVEESMKAVKKQMHSMPPSKRAQVERAYKQQLALMGRGEEMFLYDEVGSGTKVGAWATTQYVGRMGDDKLEDVWAATWRELGAPQDDFTAVTHMAEIFSSAGQKLPAFFQFGRVRGNDAFPVMVVTYEGGQETERSQVKSVIQKKLDAGVFELPDGLTPKKPPAPGR